MGDGEVRQRWVGPDSTGHRGEVVGGEVKMDKALAGVRAHGVWRFTHQEVETKVHVAAAHIKGRVRPGDSQEGGRLQGQLGPTVSTH